MRADDLIMFSLFRKKAPGPQTPPAERRAAERIDAISLMCALGEVADVSRTGVRVRLPGGCRVSKGQLLPLEIASPLESVGVQARVVRIAKNPSGRYELGLRFEDVPTEALDQLENLVRWGSTRGQVKTTQDADRLRQLIATMKLPDHYAVLGVSPRASAEDIHKKFRELARQFHPDLNPDPGAHERFCQINKANEVLSDPQRRAEYDRSAGYVAAA